jgi:hypothetical protein
MFGKPYGEPHLSRSLPKNSKARRNILPRGYTRITRYKAKLRNVGTHAEAANPLVSIAGYYSRSQTLFIERSSKLSN